MTKKIILAALSIILLFSLASCGEKEEWVERSIDGIASYLGYTDGRKITPSWKDPGEVLGAKQVKVYSWKYGEVTIYEFDPTSPEYQDLQTQTSDCIDGFVLLYNYDFPTEPTGAELAEMEAESEKIQSIRFIPEGEN